MTKLNKLFGLQFALMLRGLSLTDLKREDGQTLGEYAMILALIAVVVALVVATLGHTISSLFSQINSSV
jgi:Flp pilus assembly pilin Flp